MLVHRLRPPQPYARARAAATPPRVHHQRAAKRLRIVGVVVVAAAASTDAQSPAPTPTPTPPPPPPTAAERALLDADALLATLGPALRLPATRRQPSDLPREQRRALRAESEELAKRKALSRLQVGGNGLTPGVVAAAADALAGAPGGLLRVRLGDGCGLERRSAAVALERLLDAACVKQVGFCVTLYRAPGLPRPDNVPPSTGRRAGEEQATPPPPPAAQQQQQQQQQQKNKTKKPKRSSAAAEEAAASEPPRPPAFTVM
jgi:RNA-binding protein YhbY